MALTHSTATKNATLDTGFKTQFNSGQIKIWSGSAPGANNAATGTLLATLGINATAFTAATAGVSTANAITSDTSAAASGTAGYFRAMVTGDSVSDATGTLKRIEGTVTATGGGGDMQLNSTSITIGGTVSITSFTYTHPA